MDEGVRVIRLQNIGVGEFDDADRAYVSAEHFERLAKHRCLAGDLLIATLGDPILRACRQPAEIPEALNKADCLQLRCNPDLALPEYVVRVLNSDLVQKRAELLSHGQTRPRINLSQVRSLPIPLPPIEEQRRIAAALDQADDVRVRRMRSLAQVERLAESVFLNLAGKHAWPRSPIEALAADRRHAIRTGPFGSQLLHSEFVDDGVAVLGIDNAVSDRFVWAKPRFITPQKFDQLRRYQVHPGDVLITIMGTCGRCAVVPAEIPLAINTKHLCCISLDRAKCVPEFLWACIKYDPGVRRRLGATVRGAVMPGLNMGLIKSAEVPVPPIEVQLEFKRQLYQVNRLEGSLSRSSDEIAALFASLQRRAFAGQL